VAALAQAAKQQELDDLRRETLEALADYPEARIRIPGTALEVPRPSMPGERVVEAYIAFLDVLGSAQGQPLVEGGAAFAPPWQLFDSGTPQMIAGVLNGFNPNWVAGKKQVAHAWLDSRRDQSQQSA
jgi:hypothetical protein